MLRRINSSRKGLGAALLVGLSLVLTLVVQPANAAVIDSLSYNGHTYYLISENSWTGAAAEASSLGGYLATINNQTEQNVLWAAWQNSLGTGECLWIGLHDPNSVYHHGPGNFVWMNGEPVTYTDWAPSEPSDGHPSGAYKEDFVNLESRFGYNGRWNDLPNAGADWNPDRGIVEVDSLSSSNVQTPEVSTLVLVGSGLAGLIRRRRRLSAER
jgi:hypothetical protein